MKTTIQFKQSYFKISILLFTFFISSFAVFGQSPIMNEVKLKRAWDNFRERDASVFKFNFAVSEKFFDKNTKGRLIGGGVYSASNYSDLSGYAKYAVLSITEELLSEASGKSIIVADPELAAKRPGGRIPGTSEKQFRKHGFIDFPNWSVKKFIKYDEGVSRLIEIEVDMDQRSFNYLFSPGLRVTDVFCKVKLTVYNTDGKKIASYKHSKRGFEPLNRERRVSKLYDSLINSIWASEIKTGAPIPFLVDFYVQTLQELLQSQEFLID